MSLTFPARTKQSLSPLTSSEGFVNKSCLWWLAMKHTNANTLCAEIMLLVALLYITKSWKLRIKKYSVLKLLSGATILKQSLINQTVLSCMKCHTSALLPANLCKGNSSDWDCLGGFHFPIPKTSLVDWWQVKATCVEDVPLVEGTACTGAATAAADVTM